MDEEEYTPPECPVCLQFYDPTDAVPRVLACGHSSCEPCLGRLPHPFPNTIRCPSCNQLVSCPNPLSSLPKNIDLLRLIRPPRTPPNPNPNPNRPLVFDSSFASIHCGLWSDWKDWVIGEDRVEIERSGEGRIRGDEEEDDRAVSLVRVCSSSRGGSDDSVVRFSYGVRVVEALGRLGESERRELRLVFQAAAAAARVSRVYGVWMDLRDGSVYLVCEKLKGGVLESFVGLGKQFGDNVGGKRRVMSSFAVVGMELCEALMGLHCQGIVSGCLSRSCFGFDAFGHAFVDVGAILMLGRRVRTCVVGVDGTGIGEFLKKKDFVSPELLLELLFEKKGNAPECDSSNYAIGCFSDVWALGCILMFLLMQNLFAEEQLESLYCFVPEKGEEKCDECLAFYKHWGETTSSMLETFLGEEFSSLYQVLCRCLDLDPVGRPCVAEVWRCIRELILEREVDILANFDAMTLGKNNVQCLTIGNLCALEEVNLESRGRNGQEIGGRTSISDLDQVTEREEDLVKGVCRGKQKPISLKVHMDCISGFAIGGGFLFSSSFDKTICMWSLQDFSCVQSFRGHEHRITGIVFVESNIQLCISGDVGGGIFVWRVDSDLTNEPLKKWHEDKDWRYSGIHALAVSGAELLYTGSGDRSIKAWSLQDYSLVCTMNGHKSVISCLVVCNGVLYSGSWDGTICLWSLNDHSILTVLGEDKPGNMNSVFSLSVDRDVIVAAYENGKIKMWRSDKFSKSFDSQDGTTLALYIEGKWLFMGGWSKKINIQELAGDELQVETRHIGSISCDSVITALLFREGKLFAGFADRVIKKLEDALATSKKASSQQRAQLTKFHKGYFLTVSTVALKSASDDGLSTIGLKKRKLGFTRLCALRFVAEDVCVEIAWCPTW